jgi:hypothetical protein
MKTDRWCATSGVNAFVRWQLPSPADFAHVLGIHPKSTWFLEGYWRRRDDVPAAGAIGCSRGLHIAVSDITVSEGCLASSDTAPTSVRLTPK